MMLGNIHGILTAVSLYGVGRLLPVTLSILQKNYVVLN